MNIHIRRGEELYGRMLAAAAKKENAHLKERTNKGGGSEATRASMRKGNSHHKRRGDVLENPRQVNAFKVMWRDGFTARVICERFGIDETTVYGLARQLGLPRRDTSEQYG